MTHTILGAGGSIGIPLAQTLLTNHKQVKLVSRKGFAMEGAHSICADLLQYEQVQESVKGSEIVYLCAGLPYDLKIWQDQWPKVMRNTIDACKKHSAKLVFLDNVYMYGLVHGKMTENTPYNPCSKKGEVRARITLMLQEEIQNKNIDAIIARAADFYGPYTKQNSLPDIFVISKFLKGQKANWGISENKLHTFSYTIDTAKGMYMLAQNSECYGQVWHLPVCPQPITGKEIIELIAKEMAVKPDYMVIKKWMMQMAGLGSKTIREVIEMLYQNEHDYLFDSSKFNSHFSFSPISYERGVKETVQYFKTK